MRVRLVLLIVLSLLLTPALTSAQAGITVEQNRWDAQIMVQANSDRLQIIETQEVHIVTGAVRQGQRIWPGEVQVQSVSITFAPDKTPTPLTLKGNSQPGTYGITKPGGNTLLIYWFPTPLKANDVFTVQINYTAPEPIPGLVDWTLIPTIHTFSVKSSTIRVTFPEGSKPNASLARVVGASGKIDAKGNEFTITASGPIDPKVPFGVQIPFGDGPTTFTPTHTELPPTPVPAAPEAGQAQSSASPILFIIVVVALLLSAGGALVRSRQRRNQNTG